MIILFPHTGHRVHHKEESQVNVALYVFTVRFPRHSHSVFLMDIAVCRLNFVSKVSHSTSCLKYDQAFDYGGGIL